MPTTEETLARFIFLFLKHLSFELSNLIILSNHHHRLPTKSILRKSYEKNVSLNQNHSILLTPRKVLFTHVDSLQFDPQIPCRFVTQSQRELFYLSSNTQQMQCLCHRYSKTNFIVEKNDNPKCKVKLKRQRRLKNYQI